MSIDPIERGLEQSFELEKWGRFIRECDDIDTLRETALSLGAANGSAQGFQCLDGNACF